MQTRAEEPISTIHAALTSMLLGSGSPLQCQVREGVQGGVQGLAGPVLGAGGSVVGVQGLAGPVPGAWGGWVGVGVKWGIVILD